MKDFYALVNRPLTSTFLDPNWLKKMRQKLNVYRIVFLPLL